MGKSGGSQTTTSEMKLPKWLEEAAQKNLAIADEVAAVGYTPYGGPTVAGFNPMQQSAMGGTNMAAASLGLPELALSAGADGIDPLTGIPASMAVNGGYSAMPLYNAAKGQIPDFQRQFIESFVSNPVTGAPPTNPAVPSPQFRPPGMPGSSPVPVAPPKPLTPYEQWAAKQRDAGLPVWNRRSRYYSER